MKLWPGLERAMIVDERSYFMQQALAREAGESAAPLGGDERADVCVVGGGYTGLWTALRLKDAAPDLKVTVLEAGICGAGASGRNGGHATSWWDEIPELVELFGPEQALFLARASSMAVGALENFCHEYDVDAHFRRGGYAWTSAAPAQDGAWTHAVETCKRLGEEGRLVELGDEEVGRRVGSPILRGGALESGGASVQPALLVRGLRRVALERGVRIYEGSPMIGLDRAKATVRTPRGTVRAGKVVIATNAWAARLRELRLHLVPLSSHIVLTEPIPDKIADIGWTGGEVLTDSRLLIHYAKVTVDGRIAFGRGGGEIGPAGRVTRSVLYQPSLVASVVADFRRFFPQLAGVGIAAAWGGAVDRSPQHLPFFAPLDDAGRIFVGAGYSGNGVAPSWLGGRILASLALDARDEWAGCGLVGLPDRVLPPEPFRSVGGRLVQAAVARKERLEEEGRSADALTRALARLTWFTLPRLSPKLRRGTK